MDRNNITRFLGIASLSIIMSLSWCSCTKPEIVLTSEPSYELGFTENNKVIHFTTTKDWTAEPSASWISLMASAGRAGDNSLAFSISENAPENGERTGQITIFSEGLTASVSIKQAQQDYIRLSSEEIIIGPDGGEFKITAFQNVDSECIISLETKSWIKCISTKAITSDTFSFIADINEGFDERIGRIFFAYGNISKTVSVIQQPYHQIIPEKKDLSFISTGGEASVSIKHNYPIEISCSSTSSSWLKVETSQESSKSTVLNIQVSGNGNTARTGTIMISDGTVSSELHVSQYPSLIETSSSTLILDYIESLNVSSFCHDIVVWSSSNPDVISVSEEGRVTAHSKGSAQISATLSGSSYTEYLEIKVIGVDDAIGVAAHGARIIADQYASVMLISGLTNRFGIPITINSIWLMDDKNTLIALASNYSIDRNGCLVTTWGPLIFHERDYGTIFLNLLSKYWIRYQFSFKGKNYEKDTYVDGHYWSGTF